MNIRQSKNRSDKPSLGSGQNLGSTVPPIFKRNRQPARAPISTSLRFETFRRDNFRCRLCGAVEQNGVTLEVDHIVPISRGGTNDPVNLQTLCRACNQGKSNQLL